ncbi:hypothetical protein RSOLAG1IB_11513 [Rhizoctonia solani AG-1 IB]|uniref:Uncharacterized protein n=1 Tax=Thanatephorus cucumeris (strain AG1-IB / isolate 7/3/14) TaxID=1108050 RepID=A0A0B7F7D7_THACB|nr:hypothetical protein RSOLAG1IB_11513 [Rhizoctonia solani AG-1 IB]
MTVIGGYNWEEFVKTVRQILGQDCSTLETQELKSLLETIQNNQATQAATQEWQTQTQSIVNPPQALNVGGGFYLTAISANNPEKPPLKLTPLANPKKRMHPTQDGKNTNTEDKDNASDKLPSHIHPAASCSSTSTLLPHPNTTSISTSSSSRPIGLPRSSVNASAASQPLGLPLLGQALANINPNPLLNFGLALKDLATALLGSQTITPQQQVLLDAIQWYQRWEQTKISTGISPPPKPAIPSLLPPYTGMAPPLFIAPPPNIVDDNKETLMAILAAAAGKPIKSKKSLLRDFTGNMQQVLTGAVVNYLAYSCAKGPYKTKRTQQIWALEACRREFSCTLPGATFETPPLEALKLIVA